MAITDHDTVDGISDALTRGKEIGLEVVPGVEVSVELPNGRSFHLLGYDFEVENQELRNCLGRIQRGRSERNDQIMERLDHLGMPIDRDKLEQLARGGQVGRPHLARAMVTWGYVSSMDEAFQRFLRKGAPAYVDRFRLTPGQAIRIIREAGGVPVLAHPYTLGLQEPLELEGFIAQLVEADGLMGIEVIYPDHEVEQEVYYRFLAEKYDLLMTGGTDFHGFAKPGISLGWGRGDLRVPLSWGQRLRQRAISLKKGFILDKVDRTG
jgi:predicted metal-dependent phosphoesterase TrpH